MYDVGSIIFYDAFGGTCRKVRVTLRDENIKNGRPGFDGVIVGGPDEGLTVWGYDDQITRVAAPPACSICGRAHFQPADGPHVNPFDEGGSR